MNSNNNNRREFLKTTGKVAGFGLFAGAFGSIINSCEQDEIPTKVTGVTVTLNLAVDYPNLLNKGTHDVIILKDINAGAPVIIKHNSDDTFTVFDSICHHQGCPVVLPNTNDGIMECPCHGATFSFVDGKSVDNKGFTTAVDMVNYKNSYNPSSKILTITG